MSTTHTTVRLATVITTAGRGAGGEHTAQIGWARGTGPSPAAAVENLRDAIVDGLVDWKRPEIVSHNGRTAVIYTRPDGTCAYDGYGTLGGPASVSVITGDGSWDATRRVAWRDTVQGATDWHDDTSVAAGWRALSAAGYGEEAAEHLRYAGWQRAYTAEHKRQVARCGAFPNETARAYADEHTVEHIPSVAL